MDIASLKPVSHPHPGFLAPCFYAPGIASSKLLVSTGIDPPSRATPYHCCISWFARWQRAPLPAAALGIKLGWTYGRTYYCSNYPAVETAVLWQ